MINELDGLPGGVIGFEASGKIAAEDYRDVILPALEEVANTGDVRFLIVMRDFDGITGGALRQDLKMGIEDLRSWKRIALVTDISWMSLMTDLFGWMTPGETKTFVPRPEKPGEPVGKRMTDGRELGAAIASVPPGSGSLQPRMNTRAPASSSRRTIG